MTEYIAQPNADGLVKLSGTIRNMKVIRGNASFVLTKSDKTKLGIVAVAATIAGMSGQAASAVASASDMEEAADYIEFDLGDKHVKGWVWRNPFKEGDAVDVAAEQNEGHWESYGVARPSDRTVALYPHCSRGEMQHYRNAIKWWILGGGGFVLLALILGGGLAHLPIGKEFLYVATGCLIFFAIMTLSLSLKWLPFVRVSEKVFRTLDLPNPSNIDLVKSSKAQRTPQDPGEFGTFYFRY